MMGFFPYLQDIKNDLKWHGRAYIITDIAFKLFSFLILIPVINYIFSYFLGLYGTYAVSNTDIIQLILSPLGIITLLFMSIMLLSLFFAEHAILMAIAFASQNDQKIHWLEAFNLLRQKIKKLLLWGGGSIAVLICTIAPLALGLLYLYSRYLTEFDINYYLQQRPAEFIYFISLGLVFVIPAVFGAIYLYISWLFALPIILFETEQNIINLLKTTHRRLYGNFWQIVRALVLWWAVLFATSFLYQFILEDLLTHFLFSLKKDSHNWLLAVMVVMFSLEIAFDMLWQLMAIIGTVVIIIHIYLKQAQKDSIALITPSAFSSRFSLDIRHHFLWPLAIFIILGIALYSAYDLSRTIPAESHVNIIAHRGASFSAPPNSRAAFLEAIKQKSDYIELDVQETKDGIVIVHHDKDYKLSSNLDKAVHELNWDETHKIDIGQSFSKDFTGETVITLEEALSLAKGKAKVLIELKYYGYNQKLEERVLDIVHKYDMAQQVRYMSLNLKNMQYLKSLEPSAEVGYISSAATIGDLSKIDLDFIAVSASLASKKFIRHVQKNNKKIAVWTIDDTESMMRFLNLNVDDIITNRPERLYNVLAERKAMSKAEVFISMYYHYWKK